MSNKIMSCMINFRYVKNIKRSKSKNRSKIIAVLMQLIDWFTNLAQTEHSLETEDDDKENAEVECSEQVSENLVSSTGPWIW